MIVFFSPSYESSVSKYFYAKKFFFSFAYQIRNLIGDLPSFNNDRFRDNDIIRSEERFEVFNTFNESGDGDVTIGKVFTVKFCVVIKIRPFLFSLQSLNIYNPYSYD